MLRYVKLWLDFKIYEAPRWLFSKPILEYVASIDSCKPVNRQKNWPVAYFHHSKFWNEFFFYFHYCCKSLVCNSTNQFSFFFRQNIMIWTISLLRICSTKYIYMIYYCQNWSFQKLKLKLFENVKKSGNLLSKKYKGSFFIVWLFYLALIARQR